MGSEDVQLKKNLNNISWLEFVEIGRLLEFGNEGWGYLGIEHSFLTSNSIVSAIQDLRKWKEK